MSDEDISRLGVSLVSNRANAREVRVEAELWLVYEHVAALLPDESPSLVFESDLAIRRVRTYPTNWRELSDAELYAVSWRR